VRGAYRTAAARYAPPVEGIDPVEAVGYLASALIVLSLAMTSVVRLRWISLAGSTLFAVYGVLIGSIPIVVTNGAIAILNVWFLRRELAPSVELDVARIDGDGPFLSGFLARHLEDIHRFQPEFLTPVSGLDAYLLYRDRRPAGVLMGRREGSRLEVELDYVLPEYRDSRLGRWLFGPGAAVFTADGVERLVTRPGTDPHRSYLERMGFRETGDELVLDLPRAAGPPS
jgi:hypothetical protein